MAAAHRAFDFYTTHRFAILFFSLIGTLAIAPVAKAMGSEDEILQGFIFLNLVAAVLGSWLRTAPRLALAVLVLLLGTGAVHALSMRGFARAGDVVLVAVGLAVILHTVRLALRKGAVNNERIFAALSAYILSGLVFAVAYTLYEWEWPGSFVSTHGEALTLRTAVYFSYVTLATLGYGDIVPVSGPARGLAIIEALGGQIYLTVLVARLVSLYVSRERAGD